MNKALFANALGKIKDNAKGSRANGSDNNGTGRRVISLKNNKRVVLKAKAERNDDDEPETRRGSIMDRIKKRDNSESTTKSESRSIRNHVISKPKAYKRFENPAREKEDEISRGGKKNWSEPDKWSHDKFTGEAASKSFEPHSVFVRHLPADITEKELMRLSDEADNISGTKVTIPAS